MNSLHPESYQICNQIMHELFGEIAHHSIKAKTKINSEFSIFARISRYYERCCPKSGDFSALQPNPELNECLGRLVEILCTHYGPYNLQIHKELVQRIQQNPEIGQRAKLIKKIAGLAETQMEYFYAHKVIQKLKSTNIEDINYSQDKLKILNNLFIDFPYFENYVHLIQAELSLIAPVTIPQATTINPQISLAVNPTTNIAFCGCGPMPLSAIILHALSGTSVVLIDNDPRAIDICNQMNRELIRLDIIRQSKIKTILEDVSTIKLCGPKQKPLDTSYLKCNAVFVASLVPKTSKYQLLDFLCKTSATENMGLLLRSASGLCAELAYDPIVVSEFTTPQVRYCGQSLPAHLISDSNEPKVIADQQVLNTSELFYRLPMTGLYSKDQLNG